MMTTFDDFKNAFSYGERNNLNFKFLAHLNEAEAADFLEEEGIPTVVIAIEAFEETFVSMSVPRLVTTSFPMKNNKSILVQRSIVLTALMGAVIVYFSNPRANEMAGRIFQMFASGDFEVVRDFVSSFGPLAMLVSFFLMILTLVFPPLPAFMVTFANASFFGWWQGALLSWTSAVVGNQSTERNSAHKKENNL